MTLRLQRRPFRFALQKPLRTAAGIIQERCGWLLRLDDGSGSVGWGEVAPFQATQLQQCSQMLEDLPQSLSRTQVEARLREDHGPLAFGLGAALAELDGVVGAGASQGWLRAPQPALLLPAGEAMISALADLQASPAGLEERTLKWKVATESDALECRCLEHLLGCLPATARLRLDANGGWDRRTAASWMKLLAQEPRLAWLEQPLPVEDQQGLDQLAALGPVALDESLAHRPELRQSWKGWQVRRPSLEGDPRGLLQELQEGAPKLMLSTAFETGIGRRWLHHLAALQHLGPTPTAPGLAPGWCPAGALFDADPQNVWQAAGG